MGHRGRNTAMRLLGFWSFGPLLRSFTRAISSLVRGLAPVSYYLMPKQVLVPFPYLPADLILEVLQRLPVKTLIKFRSVCRSWDGLISDPVFRKLHHDQSKQRPTLFVCSPECYKDNQSTQSTRYHFSCIDDEGTLVKKFEKELQVPMSSWVCVMPSCMDLVCLIDVDILIVCNPATEELITLPRSDDLNDFALGFGYVPSTMEFKVLRIIHNVRCDILTLGTDIWRKVEDSPSLDFIYDGVYLKGVIHMFSGNYSDGVAVFNLEREEWVDPIPTDHFLGLEASFDDILTVLGGVLCMQRIHSDSNGMEIWMLRDYEKGVWVKEYAIKELQVSPDLFTPIKIEDDGRLLMEIDVEENDLLQGHIVKTKLQHYDPKTKEFTDFEIPIVAEEYSTSFYVENFIFLGSR